MARYLAVTALGLLFAANGAAQIADSNGDGVAMGHLHYFVRDVEAHRSFWLALGGVPMPFTAGELIEMPGLYVLLSEGDVENGPSVVDHVAFRVESLDSIAATGLDLEMVEAYPGIASVYTPSGDRVELFEEGTATNVGFDPDVGDTVAERHNRPLTKPIDSHHLHFYLPEEQIPNARDWYVTHFGAIPGIRWRYTAADLPGMNLNFSAADSERTPTRGRSLDHIGFEIDDLEAFCRALEDRGIVFDRPFERVSPVLAYAVVTDPWGTTIELTEGLSPN